MPILVGALLPLAIGVMATTTGLDRDRAFYPTATIVIGGLYVLFAAIGASMQTLLLEALVGLAFLVAAIVGFRSTLWVVVAALVLHGLFDLTHGRFIANAGVPRWWPGFCLTYDVTAAAYLAFLLKTGRTRARALT